MNKKGQIGLGLILIAFVGIIVGLAFWQPLADNMGRTTNTFTTVNQTVNISGTGTILTGQGISGTPIITNTTGQQVVANGNFTFYTAIDPTSGYVRNYVKNTTLGSIWTNKNVNITYTYEPEGYVSDMGSRSIVLLIMIFFALGIAVIALVPVARNEVLSYVGR